MFSARNWILLGLVVAAFVIFSPRSSAQTISCSSDDGHRHYCPADTRGGVRLLKQRSDSPCNQGYSWGFDRGGVWVDRGCRADFAVDSYQYRGPAPGSTGTISCSSDDGHRHYCDAGSGGRIRLVQQRSESPCREGYSWGSDGRGVWVDHGCRADFAVEGGRGGGGTATATGTGTATGEVRTRSFPVHRTTCTVTTARLIREAECGCSSSAATLPAARATAGATTAVESGWITAAAPISRSSANLRCETKTRGCPTLFRALREKGGDFSISQNCHPDAKSKALSVKMDKF